MEAVLLSNQHCPAVLACLCHPCNVHFLQPLQFGHPECQEEPDDMNAAIRFHFGLEMSL